MVGGRHPGRKRTSTWDFKLKLRNGRSEARGEVSTQMVQGGGEPEHTWNREWVKVWVSASRVQEEFKERKQSLP